MTKFYIQTPWLRPAVAHLGNELPNGMRKRIDDYVRNIAKVGLRRAKDDAPRRSGKLAKRLHIGKEGWADYYITSDVKYFPFVVLGTRPHTIRPRNKKALYWPGANHPVAVIHHPGTKPNDFMDKALENVTRDKVFSDILDRIRKFWCRRGTKI